MKLPKTAIIGATGFIGKFFFEDDQQWPDTMLINYEYPGKIVQYEMRLPWVGSALRPLFLRMFENRHRFLRASFDVLDTDASVGM